MKGENTKPTFDKVVYWLMFVIGLGHMLFLRFASTAPQMKAILFLMYVLVCIFLVKRSKWMVLDIVFIVLSAAPLMYYLINFEAIQRRITSPTPIEWVLAIMIILAVLEATRRTTGNPLVIISIIFLIYGFIGPYLPGLLWHRGFTLKRLTQNMFITTNGIFSSPMQTAATIIVSFVVMGELMVQCGAGDFFTKGARRITHKMIAGNAKMSIVAGMLFGMINGSAAANVVTTGQITIPLMKEEGYSSEYSGAIAAASACGGPLTPPVMGSGAFLLAEFVGITYGEVCIRAIIPAILFYFAVFTCVHFEARKNGVVRQEIPEDDSSYVYFKNGKKVPLLVQYFNIFIPLVFLIVLIVISYPILYACMYSMVAMLIMTILNPWVDFGWKNFVDTFVKGVKNSLGVTAACACSGIIVCVIGTTGLGLAFASFIIGNGVSLLVTMILTMILLIILGMGMTGVAAYIVGASVAANVFKQLGVPLVTTHMFIYYFSVLAVLTPPVAITSYAAAGISGGNPTKTGWKSVALACAGFIAPFVFVLDPALILQSDALSCIIRIALTGFGVFGIALGITGFFKNRMHLITRIVLVLGGLFAVYPTTFCDVTGTVLVAVGILINILLEKPRAVTLA